MPRPSNARTWTVVGLLCAGFTIAYIDRTNLSIALASPGFKSAFGLSDTQRGLLNSAFFWSYALLQIPAGYWTDRFGVRVPYAISFVLWSAVSGATAFASSASELFALRLLLGVGEAVCTPASLRWISLNVDEKHRGLAVGILFAGSKFGPAIGADLAVRLIQSYGWRGMFVILGFGSLVFLLPWLWLVREDRGGRAANFEAAGAEFASIWHTRAIYGILIGTVAYNYFNYFNLTWLPAYFVERWKLSFTLMGHITSFSYFGMAVVSISGGAVADWMIRRGARAVPVRRGFTIAGLAIASTEIVGSFTASRDVALAFAVFSMLGLGLATANYWALTQALMPARAIGRISGVQNFASNLAGVASPALTGWLIQTTGSYTAPMRAILLVLAAGIAAYIWMVRERYAPRVIISKADRA